MRRVLIEILRICGHERPQDALADLEDERRASGRGRGAFVLWAAWQFVAICGWGLRDRWMKRRPPQLHPAVALRLAARNIRHHPAMPIAAALTLALGYGAAASIFGVYQGFGRPLPVLDGERLVRLRIAGPTGVRTTLSRRQLDVVRDAGNVFDRVGAFAVDSAVLAGADVPARRVSAAAMSPATFRALQVPPALGALPAATDSVVVLGHELWIEAFAADPSVIGKAVRVDGRVMDVAAVMPVGFAFPYRQQLWLPLDPAAADLAVEVLARLAPGVSPEQATRMLQARWLAAFPDPGGQEARTLVNGFTEERGEVGENMALLALLALVIALLLVSCSNVSNLMLARAVARSRALALHAAIGAGPGQVRLQMLTEAVLIALGGAAAGLGVASVAVRYIESTLAGHWGYYWMRVQMEPAVVGFTLLLAVVTALVAGLLPALRAARADVSTPLKQGADGDRRSNRVSWLLLTGQVALSAAALVIAALMAQGLLRTRHVEAGFPAADVHVASVVLDTPAYESGAARTSFRQGLLGKLSQAPALRSAALSVGLPGLQGAIGRLAVDGVEADPEARPIRILTFGASPQFFDVFDLDLERGRLLLPGDIDVVVVSADFARRHLAGEPLGRRIRLAGVADRWWRVVGVVSDIVIYDASRDRPLDWAYLPLEQLDPAAVYVTYRAAAAPADAERSVRAAVAALDPDLPLSGAMGVEVGGPVTAVLAFVRRFMQTAATLAAMGGVAAALVAAIGLYGVLAFEVNRRMPDFGVRLALGARSGQVLRQVLGHALLRTAPGLILGLALAWASGPAFGLFLFGVSGRSFALLGAAASVYLLVAALAALAPARRAAGLDPARILRSD